MSDNYTTIIKRISEGEAFKGNTMMGLRTDFPLAGFTYEIFSYRQQIAMLVVRYATKEAFIFRNERKYSKTTSTHQNYAWRGLTAMHATLANDLGYTVHNIFKIDGEAIEQIETMVFEMDENYGMEVTA